MNKLLFVAIALLVLADSAFSQGIVVFANRGGTSTTDGLGEVRAPVYNVDSTFLANDATHTFIATLWALNSGEASGSAENNNLQLVQVNGTTTFRTATSGTFAGIWNQPSSPSVVPGVALATDRATFQVRVWDTMGGTVTSWDQVLADPSIARGYSGMFTVPFPLGATQAPPNPPPYLQGLESFQLFVPDALMVPEPSMASFLLIGIGALVSFCSRSRRGTKHE
jgi:hypothetical protein